MMAETTRKPMPLPVILLRAAGYPACRPVVGLWVPVAAAIAGYVTLSGALGIAATLGLMGLGWVGWTFLEYHLHRHVQHWQPASARLLALRETALPHLKHHAQPDNPRVVVLTRQRVPMLLWLGFFGLGALVAPPAVAAAFLAGSGLGYAVYELIHFSCHQYEMAGRLPRRLKQHHLFHHFRDDSCNFGVSTTLWDRVFGTLYRPGANAARARAGH